MDVFILTRELQGCLAINNEVIFLAGERKIEKKKKNKIKRERERNDSPRNCGFCIRIY